jgi:heme-binding protein
MSVGAVPVSDIPESGFPVVPVASDHEGRKIMNRQILDEGVNMLPYSRPARRTITGAIGIGVLAGTMLFGAAAVASAEPPAPVPPPCTAAELARVMSGVTFDTSNYLTEHPNVNDFFTSLKGQPKDQINDQVRAYFDANPAIRDELQQLRQPSVDFRARCGVPGSPVG